MMLIYVAGHKNVLSEIINRYFCKEIYFLCIADEEENLST